MTTQRWVRCARVKPDVTSYTVTNLTEGKEYYFRVIAENVEGLGDSLLSDTPVETQRLACKNLLLSLYYHTYGTKPIFFV